MKIKCKHFQSNNMTFLCELCTYYSRCTLYKPTNKNHTLLQNEINYWLNEYNKAKDRIKEYETILNDIIKHDYKYSNSVNVYGNIQYYPKKNVFNVFIRKPEHVMYGWHLNELEIRVDELLNKIRLLNRKELNMRKILEKKEAIV